MKSIINTVSLLLCFIIHNHAFSQTDPFEPEKYREFLEQNQDMETSELLNMFPAGYFPHQIEKEYESVEYFDMINNVFELTSDEKELLHKHGFMVSERLSFQAYNWALTEIHRNDLPVFISTDAMLHAFHRSYDAILKEIETDYLIPTLIDFLKGMHNHLPQLEAKYPSEEMKQMLHDVDMYLYMPLNLLGELTEPYYPENKTEAGEIKKLINAENFSSYPFFSSNCKLIDFSQFKPRGHYTDDPLLEKYFKAMIWLGRIEIYLVAPDAGDLICPPQTKDDIQRQIIDAVLLQELLEGAGVTQQYGEMEEIIRFFVGNSDNVSPDNMAELVSGIDISGAQDLLDTNNINRFQQTLREKSYAGQQILSQLLQHDPMSTESVKPASSFMLFGQRFVIDSYVTGNVIYDKIIFDNSSVCRLFPSTLDILFALGNVAATQLLMSELENFHYASNLAGLRYLIDHFDPSFWEGTIYNLWLNCIRALNPPPNRDHLPEFMKTSAWWQEKMNSQLTSWTELRHDNLLYAKQSYTAMPVCDFASGYVEPIPEFYQNLKKLAEVCRDKLQDNENILKVNTLIPEYFDYLMHIADTLENIAIREINGTFLTAEEKLFLNRMLEMEMEGCATSYDGWYPKLFYNLRQELGDALGMAFPHMDADYLVADYHTTPADCGGNTMGWVLHAGTGNVNLLVMITERPDGKSAAYVGPVGSYHEYVTTNFERLTDEEWEETYLWSAARPEWVKNYLADKNGKIIQESQALFADENDFKYTTLNNDPVRYRDPEGNPCDPNDVNKIAKPVSNEAFFSVYPNPFAESAVLRLQITSENAFNEVLVSVYNVEGKRLNILLHEELPAGNYMVRWEGTNQAGNKLNDGIYLVEVMIGENRWTRKVSFRK